MAVQLGQANFAGGGNLSARVTAKFLARANFAGTGVSTVAIRVPKVFVEATFVGVGIGVFDIRVPTVYTEAIFAGTGSLSAVDSVISMQMSILVTSTLQAVATNSLANLMGNPKTRLVFAIEVGILPIN